MAIFLRYLFGEGPDRELQDREPDPLRAVRQVGYRQASKNTLWPLEGQYARAGKNHDGRHLLRKRSALPHGREAALGERGMGARQDEKNMQGFGAKEGTYQIPEMEKTLCGLQQNAPEDQKEEACPETLKPFADKKACRFFGTPPKPFRGKRPEKASNGKESPRTTVCPVPQGHKAQKQDR